MKLAVVFCFLRSACFCVSHQSDVWSPAALLERVAPSDGRLWRPAQERAVRSPDWPHSCAPLPAGRRSHLLLNGPGEACTDALTLLCQVFWWKKLPDGKSKCELTRLLPFPHLCLRLVTRGHISLLPKCWRSRCIVRNVVARFWQGKRTCGIKLTASLILLHWFSSHIWQDFIHTTVTFFWQYLRWMFPLSTSIIKNAVDAKYLKAS